MNAVETDQLEKRYGRVRALAGVSIEIPHGRLVHVSGPNGAGKSTLLRVLAALCRPTRGAVRVSGADPYGRRAAAVRADIAYVGATSGLYAELSVEENLNFGARLRGLREVRVDEALNLLGIGHLRGRRVATLSQGFRRRVGLARALLDPPRLLLLDEPWNALDVDASQRLVRLLRGCRDRGATALVASHARPGTEELWDATIQLEAGSVVAPAGARA